jgi:hypothetical protein
MTQLTLTVEEAIARQAEEHAAANGKSVSDLFAEFVKSLGGSARPIQLGPMTRKLSGIITLPADKNDKELVADVIAERHGFSG